MIFGQQYFSFFLVSDKIYELMIKKEKYQRQTETNFIRLDQVNVQFESIKKTKQKLNSNANKRWRTMMRQD